MLLTSGYSTKVLAFLITSSLESEVKVNLGNGIDNLSWIVKHPNLDNVFYATHEVESGAVSRWKIDEEGKLNMLEKVPSGGTHPTHLAINDKGTALYVANYGVPSGSFAVLNLDRISGEIQESGIRGFRYGAGSNGVPDRQKDAHAHAVIPWRDSPHFVYVVDLGSDKIYHYAHNEDDATGSLRKLGKTDLPLGWGPRHMAISKNMAYVIYELKNRVGVYRLNPSNGAMVEVQSIPTIEDNDIKDGEPEYGAEIQAHPNGKWLYVSNRGTGPMLLYHIDQQTGLLTSKPELTPKRKGVWPRHFTISKDGNQLFVVEQKLNKLQIWKIHSEDGSLTKEQEAPSENSPAVVVEF